MAPEATNFLNQLRKKQLLRFPARFLRQSASVNGRCRGSMQIIMWQVGILAHQSSMTH